MLYIKKSNISLITPNSKNCHTPAPELLHKGALYKYVKINLLLPVLIATLKISLHLSKNDSFYSRGPRFCGSEYIPWDKSLLGSLAGNLKTCIRVSGYL